MQDPRALRLPDVRRRGLWFTCRAVSVPLVQGPRVLLVGPVLILTNKHILKDLQFDYPMALSGLGLIVWQRMSHGHGVFPQQPSRGTFEELRLC